MHLAPRTQSRISGRTLVVVSAIIALIAMFLSLFQISLSPPSVHRRGLQIAAASQIVMVDTRNDATQRLSSTYDQTTSLTYQATLIANLITTPPVIDYIGRKAGIDPALIDANTPITADVPRSIIEPDSGSNASALVNPPDHYVLQIQPDPSVPVLHIYAQAPTAAAAISLANATTSGLTAYLSRLTSIQGVKLSQAIKIVPLGPAHGGIVNGSAPMEIALLTLVTAFFGAGFLIRFGSRVRLGWRLEDLRTQP